MFNNVGSTELIIAVVVLFILFGGKKLPEFSRSLGLAMKEFKKAQKEMKESIDDTFSDNR